MKMAGPQDGFPRQYGKFQLLARIGHGGMAEVYRARLPGVAGFEKIVVIKRLLPHLAADQSMVEMFVHEAKLAAEVQHRNVVQVFELGQTDDGEFYMAMEHVAGTDLRQILRAAAINSTRIPPWFSVYALTEILDGLAFAHELQTEQGRKRNVVHRDVTPANIFVSYLGDIKLGDFGVARDDSRTSMTRAGQLKGKVPYMSPEQLYGRSLDARTDVFAAGVVLWECLTQRRLFGGRPDIEAMNLICYGERKPPSLFTGDVPRQLDEVVMRALHPDPEMRTGSARELRDDLHEILPLLRDRVLQKDVRSVVEALLGSRDPSSTTRPIHDEAVVRHNFSEQTPGSGNTPARSVSQVGGLIGAPSGPVRPAEPHLGISAADHEDAFQPGPDFDPFGSAVASGSTPGAPLPKLQPPPSVVDDPYAGPDPFAAPDGYASPGVMAQLGASLPQRLPPPALGSPSAPWNGYGAVEAAAPPVAGLSPINSPVPTITPSRISPLQPPQSAGYSIINPSEEASAHGAEAALPGPEVGRPGVGGATLPERAPSDPSGPRVEIAHPFWIEVDGAQTTGPHSLLEALSRIRHECQGGRGDSLRVSADRARWMDLGEFAILTGQEILFDRYAAREKELPASAFQGDFVDMSAATLFARIWRERPTGRLIISATGPLHPRREILLNEGRPTFVYGNAAELQLPDLAVQKMMIAKDLLPEVVHKALREERALEQVICERGRLDTARVFAALMRERLVDMFRWRTARFAIDEGVPLTHTTPFAPSMLALLPELVTRTKNVSELRAALEPYLDVRLEPSEELAQGLAELRLTEPQQQLVTTLSSGEVTVGEAMSAARDERGALVLTHILLETDLVLQSF